jgi:hypothetical protein
VGDGLKADLYTSTLYSDDELMMSEVGRIEVWWLDVAVMFSFVTRVVLLVHDSMWSERSCVDLSNNGNLDELKKSCSCTACVCVCVCVWIFISSGILMS